jgi:DNA-binding winged helix-turn-helix (wHTH) protein/dienelactone hydrolase
MGGDENRRARDLEDVSSASSGAERLRIGDCLIVPKLNRIERDGTIVRVQRLSMEVLLYLAKRPGSVVTYEEFLSALWPRRHTGEEAVHRRIAALRRHLGDIAKSPRYIETIPKRGYRLIAPVAWLAAAPATKNRFAASRWAMIAGAAAVAAAGMLILNLANRTTSQSTPGARAIRIDLMSSPVGAEVAFKPYSDPAAAWQSLGVTPIRSSLPEGPWALRLMADGHETIEIAVSNPGLELNNVDAAPYTVVLPRKGSVPAGMIFVPENDRPIPLWGYTTQTNIGDYYIARTEVSNAEFDEFVAAGGYHEPSYWRDLLDSVDAMNFSNVAAQFTDSTGAPGPAGWIDGTYRPGTAELPVAGVSWYEAMAYARFRGMTLPAAPHWARAALGVIELERPFAPVLLEAANLDGAAPLPVSDEHARSPLGALNLIGNVQEWTQSSSGRKKLSLGVSFRGQSWQYAMPTMADPLTRLPTQGFRLAQFDEEHFEFRHLALDGMLPTMPEISDDTYAALLAELSYEQGSLDAAAAAVISEIDEGGWTRRNLLIPTSYEDEPLPVVMFVPDDTREPLQSLIYITPGSRGPESVASDNTDIRRYQLEFLIESGRALVWPILYGTHERYTGEIDLAPTREERILARRREILRHREEIGRLIDYLDASPDFDGERIGMLAASGGALVISPQLLAAEARIKAVVFLAGGVAAVEPDSMPLLLNPNSYWSRLKIPAFFAHGRYDIGLRFAPPDTVGGTLYDVFGTAEADKRIEVYEMAHWPFPPLLLAEDLLPWLDDYLGSVH